jgi:hypothetical protein
VTLSSWLVYTWPIPVLGIIWFLWLNQRAAYRNGFCDGTRYMREGPTYPSKPSPAWHGWDEVEKLRAGGSRP